MRAAWRTEEANQFSGAFDDQWPSGIADGASLELFLPELYRSGVPPSVCLFVCLFDCLFGTGVAARAVPGVGFCVPHVCCMCALHSRAIGVCVFVRVRVCVRVRTIGMCVCCHAHNWVR